MAEDPQKGAGSIRADAGSPGPALKVSGKHKAGASAPEPAYGFALSRFWAVVDSSLEALWRFWGGVGSSLEALSRLYEKLGSLFSSKEVTAQTGQPTANVNLDSAVAPVGPMTWYTARTPISVGVGLSIAWLAIFVFYITWTLGWSELFILSLPEFTGLFTVSFMPIAFLWVLIALIDRGRQSSQEGEALRVHLARLTYPADGEAENVDAVTASLKRQADALTGTGNLVSERLKDIQAHLTNSTDKLSTVNGQLEAGASMSAAVVTKQVAELNEVIDGATGANQKIEDSLRRQHEFIGSASQETFAQISTMNSALEGQVARLNDATELSKGLSAEIAQQAAQQEERLFSSNEISMAHAKHMAEAVSKHVEAIELVTKRVDVTVSNIVQDFQGQSMSLGELFANQRTELTTAGDRIDDLSAEVNARLGQQTTHLDQVMEHVLSRVKVVEEALSMQTKELSMSSDDAVARLRSVENMIKQQADGVDEVASKVEARLGRSSEEFEGKSRVITERFNTVAAGLDKASEIAIERAEAMCSVSDVVVQKIDSFGLRVREHAEQLSSSAERTAAQAESIRETLRRQNEELETAASTLTKHVKSSETSMAQQSRQMDATSEQVLSHTRNMSYVLGQNSSELMQASARITKELESIRQGLEQTANTAMEVADQSALKTKAVSRKISKEVTALPTVTGEVAEARQGSLDTMGQSKDTL